jgi:Domain of unknown function (DUF4333)
VRKPFVSTVAAMLVMAACGSDTIDADEVEGEIEQQLSIATSEVASVSCPDDVEEEVGARFECNAKLKGGGKAVVTVTQLDRSEFRYDVKPGTLKLADDTLEPYLEQALAAEGVGAKVDCPNLSPVRAGETTTCDVAGAGGRQATLSFTWQDDTGNVDMSTVETTP